MNYSISPNNFYNYLTLNLSLKNKRLKYLSVKTTYTLYKYLICCSFYFCKIESQYLIKRLFSYSYSTDVREGANKRSDVFNKP